MIAPGELSEPVFLTFVYVFIYVRYFQASVYF